LWVSGVICHIFVRGRELLAPLGCDLAQKNSPTPLSCDAAGLTNTPRWFDPPEKASYHERRTMDWLLAQMPEILKARRRRSE
jgi:hypothetical protein